MITDYKPGKLNSVRARGDDIPQSDGFIDSMMNISDKFVRENIFEESGPYRAIVVQVISQKGDDFTAIRARIPELNMFYPVSDNMSPNNIKIYPVFIAQDKDVSQDEVNVGDIVWVDFEDSKNFMNGIYLGKEENARKANLSSGPVVGGTPLRDDGYVPGMAAKLVLTASDKGKDIRTSRISFYGGFHDQMDNFLGQARVLGAEGGCVKKTVGGKVRYDCSGNTAYEKALYYCRGLYTKQPLMRLLVRSENDIKTIKAIGRNLANKTFGFSAYLAYEFPYFAERVGNGYNETSEIRVFMYGAHRIMALRTDYGPAERVRKEWDLSPAIMRYFRSKGYNEFAHASPVASRYATEEEKRQFWANIERVCQQISLLPGVNHGSGNTSNPLK